LESKQRYTFTKEEKLKSRKTIEQLFKEGKSFSNFPFKIIWKFNEASTAELQAGFAVSNKQFKKAVDRNRIKRLVRESYRLQKDQLQQQLKNKQKHLAVFFIYVGNELPEYSFIFEKTGKAIKHLIKISSENSLADT
jgi:ribonuclease P protein component